MDTSKYEKQIADSQQTTTSEEILKAYGITEYTVEDLIREFEDAIAYKVEQARVFKILDAADHSDIWKIYNKKIPAYYQTPTNNPITVIKEATKASIMPTAYAGMFKPMTLEGKKIADTANRYMQMKWQAASMDSINAQAGDYAFLHGTAGVLFGWNQNIIDATDYTGYFNQSKKSQIQAKALHPSNLFPDPGAASIDEAQFLYIAERKTKQFLKQIARFSNSIANIEYSSQNIGQPDSNYILDEAKNGSNNVVTFITAYKRLMRMKPDPTTGEMRLYPCVDIIYMAGRHILDISKDIQPSTIPFVPLYDEEIPNNFWGISKCYKVLSLVMSLNEIDSIQATSIIKNQNPAQFINAASGLNVAEYQRKKENPDRAFTVNGNPTQVVYTEARPEVSRDLLQFREYLIRSIQEVSGVDQIYLGSSFGSIQTTGGVQQAVNRSTMRDSVRIKNIDVFIRKEIELMLQFYLANLKTPENFFAKQNNSHDDMGVKMRFDPMELIGREDIEIVVENAAPRTTASYEEAAMKLMELEMKYSPAEKGYPSIITPEEVIQWLNIPQSQRQAIIDRMALQYQNLKLEEYTAVLTAVGTLTQGGMPVEQAVQEVVAQIQASTLGQLPAKKMPQQ
jgi:hypothetical protein